MRPIRLKGSKANRFTAGVKLWTNDGVRFHRGDPPPPKPGGTTLTVTAVDYKRGIVTVG